jgi:NAD(P)-dependent dehydrogenase (short-subunit alcohol dehydrogenase family)
MDGVMNDLEPAAGNALVIGAGGGIAQALIERLLSDEPSAKIIAISRNPLPASLSENPRIQALYCDNSQLEISEIAEQLSVDKGTFGKVFICQGILHTPNLQPEKRLQDIDAEHMAEVLRVNTIVPALWLAALMPLLKGNRPCRLAIFSARVGSISDNRAGGWYSYRASKAALNMIIKTAAVEYARSARNVKLLAYHPGTVDTELSRPFQRNVPPEKLFTAEYTATQLLKLMEDLPMDGEASYLDWAGETILW